MTLLDYKEKLMLSYLDMQMITGFHSSTCWYVFNKPKRVSLKTYLAITETLGIEKSEALKFRG